jgi:hypothetical protein
MPHRSGLVTSMVLAGVLGCGAPNYVVVHNPVATVRVTPALDTIPFGGTVALQVATFDLNGAPTIPDHHPVWTSLNTAIFDVDSVGLVSSHWYGAGTIRVIVDGKEADALIVALPPRVIKVSVQSPALLPERGDTVQFQVTATNEVQLSVPTTGARWTVSDSTKMRVDSTGRGLALGLGVVTVRVTFAGLSDSVVETVLVPAASVSLFPDTLTLAFGATDSFQVTIRDSLGNVLPGRPMTVVTSGQVHGPQVVIPPETYVPVTGIAAGLGKVTVTVGHVRDSAAVSVDSQHILVFTSAAVGGAFTCALTTDSAAYCWGWGHGGELGTGDTVTGPRPRAVAGGFKFVSLTAGPDFACGLAVTGGAYCWGSNATEQLGTTGGNSATPTAVGGGHQYTALDAHFSVFGDSVTGGACGLAVGGQVYCWGSSWGATPVAVGAPGFVDRVALGALGYCGVHAADTAAYCWSSSSAPARLAGWDSLPLALQGGGSWSVSCGISASVVYCGGMWPVASASWQPMTLSSSTPVPGVTGSAVEAAAGVGHVCVNVITQIVCRGDNTRGELGATTGTNFLNTFIGVQGLPSTSSSPSHGLMVGWSHSCVFGTDHLLYCWGDNSKWQAGSSTPVEVGNATPVMGQLPSP